MQNAHRFFTFNIFLSINLEKSHRPEIALGECGVNWLANSKQEIGIEIERAWKIYFNYEHLIRFRHIAQ
jgi:hypothetical protein